MTWFSSTCYLLQFQGAARFNSDLSNWNVAKVQTMRSMFGGAEAFEGGNLSAWNTSRVTSMEDMFANATSFTGEISAWDTSNVTSMRNMVSCRVFIRAATAVPVSLAHSFFLQFSKASLFNLDLSEWNVARVKDASHMFSGDESFDRSLCRWGTILPTDVNVEEMFELSGCANKDDPASDDLASGPFCTTCV